MTVEPLLVIWLAAAGETGSSAASEGGEADQTREGSAHRHPFAWGDLGRARPSATDVNETSTAPSRAGYGRPVVVSTGHPSQVSIELCGEMRLDVAGRRRERELPGRLGRVLLAYLALNHHRAVTRDELIEALWPSGGARRPGGHAQHAALRRPALRRRRPSCAAGASFGSTLPADAQLDVETAAARVERSRAALGAGDAGAAAAEAEAALDVLERGLLRGVDVPWLDAFRRELEDERLDALELLARAGLAAGEAGIRRSHWASRQIISLAPFRESGYALLMDAQVAQGNTAEALETYERLRAAHARRARRDAVARAESGAPAAARAHGRRAGGERGAGAAAPRGAGARRGPAPGREGPTPSRCCAAGSPRPRRASGGSCC